MKNQLEEIEIIQKKTTKQKEEKTNFITKSFIILM